MIDYSEDWLILLCFKKRGSVAGRALLFALPSSLLTLFILLWDDGTQSFREDSLLSEVSRSQLWTATTSVLGILLAFRTNRAMSRFWEGTGLLHQMRGEWFDSVSCCVTFSIGSLKEKRDEVMIFRHTLVRLMSLCHGSALAEIAAEDADSVQVIDSFGLDERTLQHLKDCKYTHKFNSVEVLLHLIQSLITYSLESGILKIPPPILSRVYQTLSRGFVNLLNAKKIADTRFPFPYAQLITLLLLFHTMITPLLISSLFKSKIWATLFTFIPIFSMFSLNFIGIELENPFGDDDNDLPLDHFQSEMNMCLMMLLQENADHIAGLNTDKAILDFPALQAKMCSKDDDNSPKLRTSQFLLDGPEATAAGSEKEQCDGEAMSPRGSRTSDKLSSVLLATPRSSVGRSTCNSAPVEAGSFIEGPRSRSKLAAVGDVVHSTPQLSASKKCVPASNCATASLARNMDDLNCSLQRWTQLINDQILELASRFAALEQLDSLRFILDEQVVVGSNQHDIAEEAAARAVMTVGTRPHETVPGVTDPRDHKMTQIPRAVGDDNASGRYEYV